MTIAEQVKAWEAMSIISLEQIIDAGNEWCEATRELMEQQSDTGEVTFDMLLEEIEENELYLEVAQGIVAQKYLQQIEDKRQ